MPRLLPPLNALPSFEAAARHLSFSRAADELHVTHGAVSRAVRNLEDHLGVQLMIRATRSVRLTPIGASYAAEIRDVLGHLATATSAATGQSSGMLTVSTIDSSPPGGSCPGCFGSGGGTAISTCGWRRRSGWPISSATGSTSPSAVVVANIRVSQPNC